MTIEGYTVSELAEKTGKTRHAVESWLSYNSVKPIVGELLYPPDTLDRLKKARIGRPKKPQSVEPLKETQNPDTH